MWNLPGRCTELTGATVCGDLVLLIMHGAGSDIHRGQHHLVQQLFLETASLQYLIKHKGTEHTAKLMLCTFNLS